MELAPEQSLWHDIVRKPFDSVEAARAAGPEVLEVLRRSSQAALYRKLLEGYEVVEDSRAEAVGVLPVVERLTAKSPRVESACVELRVWVVLRKKPT